MGSRPTSGLFADQHEISGHATGADHPRAPDGSDRRVGRLRRPPPAPIRGPEAGVPDLSGMSLLERLTAGGPVTREAGEPLPSDQVDFQHRSERRFARLLDFYGIAWEYEPDEFPIEWDGTGAPRGWFRPDFHLPGFDLYIEITTSQQRLVTKKNRKLRLLREHHPRIRCKLFYQRDYLELVRKYGLAEDLQPGEDE